MNYEKEDRESVLAMIVALFVALGVIAFATGLCFVLGAWVALR